jgi:ornithine cyclodeaminase
MGSDAEHKNELDPAIFKLPIIYVADSTNQTSRLGELHHAIVPVLSNPKPISWN